MTRVPSFEVMATLPTLLMFLVLSSSVHGTLINVQNKCGQVITACDAAGRVATVCYVLAANGGSNLRNFGSTWNGGLIWAYPGTNTDPNVGNQAKTVASKMEMTTNGGGGLDYYDLSNVDGYNLPLLVNPTSNVVRSGFSCGTPICQIPNLNQVCGSPNFLSGSPAFGCKNMNGGGTVATSGTSFFKNYCPNAFSYSSDYVTDSYTCPTGANYEVVFCP